MRSLNKIAYSTTFCSWRYNNTAPLAAKQLLASNFFQTSVLCLAARKGMGIKMIELKSGKIRVEILEPDSERQGIRFDRMGFISCVYFENEPITSEYFEDNSFVGSGLCNEFGITSPVGYKEGEWFIKIGVGLLKADSEPYSFMKNYECVPGKCFYKKTSQNSAEFVTEVKTEDYGILYKKTVSLERDNIKIAYILENTGIKAIETDEYAHNFLKLRPGYKAITAPVSDDSTQRIAAENNILSIPCEKSENFICRYKPKNPNEFSWCILDGKLKIHESAHFSVKNFSVWKTNEIISPEVTCDIRIEPRETKEWERVYTFRNIQRG